MRTIRAAHTYFRASRLTLGLFPWHKGAIGRIPHAGSGVFITPHLALTAKHVTADFLTADTRVDRTRHPRLPFQPTYSTVAFQVDLLGDHTVPVTWSVEASAASDDTDLTILRLVPECEMAQNWLRYGLSYFEWHLAAPPIGARVNVFGMPGSQIGQQADTFSVITDFTAETATVTESYAVTRSPGFLEYPCFKIDKPLDHGFSGGPVTWNGRLCGIVSAGPNFEPAGWIAALWPILAMGYERDGVTHPIGDLFDDGTLQATDWNDVRERLRRRVCEEVAGCLREHLILETS